MRMTGRPCCSIRQVRLAIPKPLIAKAILRFAPSAQNMLSYVFGIVAKKRTQVKGDPWPNVMCAARLPSSGTT